MTSGNIYKIGIQYLREKRLKSFLCGFIYFILSRRNLYIDNLRYLLARIHNRGTYYTKVTVNGNLMYIDFRDNGISKELYIHRKREHFSTEFIKKFISEDEIIIDIGANIGYYALIESRLANKGKVYAVEPIPSNVYLLKRNIELNNCKNISVFQFAIGDIDGKAKIYVYDKCNWCSLTKNLNANIINEIEIITMTLDRFVESYVCQYPTFVRMDVEGYEYQIIKGASNILEKNKPLKLCIELHPHLMPRENMEELINILEQSDFKVKAIFLDPEPHDYNNINTMNKLRRIMNLPELGFVGNSYKDLNKLLKKKRYAPIAFFERRKGENRLYSTKIANNHERVLITQ